MLKKIFIFSTVIFFIAGTYFFVQFFLFREKDVFTVNNEKEDKKTIPDNKKFLTENKIEKIVEGNIKNPQINNLDNKILYFNQNNFLSTNFDGTTKTSIGAYPFKEIKSIEWSPDNKNVIVKDSEGFYIFNVDNSKADLFKSNADNVIWGKTNNQLIYKFYDPVTKKRTLNISDLTGQKWQEITEIPFKDAEIKLNPRIETVALFSKPTASQETQLFLVDLIAKEKKEIFKKYKGADYKWSPNGEKLLFSYAKEAGKINLAVMNIKNEIVVELNFPGLVDKCIWAKDSVEVYCASLTLKDSNIILPDDWILNKISSADTFWKINTITGEQQRLVALNEINEEVDASFLLLDENETTLFFLDRKSGNLFRIKLK